MATWWSAPKKYIEPDTKPRPLEVLRDTDQFVIVPYGKRERREAKDTDYCTLHPTLEAAWDAIEQRAQRAVENAENALEHRRIALAAIKVARERHAEGRSE